MHRNKPEHLILVKLYRLAWREVVRRDNDRLIRCHRTHLRVRQQADHPFGDIAHVSRTLLHVGIVHRGKHLREVVGRGADGIFSIDLLGLDDVLNRFTIILIVEHHLMDVKDHGVGLADLHHRLFIEFLELADCFRFCRFEPADLSLRVVYMIAFNDVFPPPVKGYPSDGNAAEHTFAFDYVHIQRPPLGL